MVDFEEPPMVGGNIYITNGGVGIVGVDAVGFDRFYH